MRVKGSKDPYRLTEKLPGGVTCKDCGATVKEGRWIWKTSGKSSVVTTCPACRRIEDGYPAGFLAMEGQFLQENRKQIMNMVRSVAEAEKNEHPMERIMDIREDREGTLITTTGMHITRRLGVSLKRSYRGDLQVQYDDSEKRIRVNWSR
jgi:NMD protein affecting ribosome stability and mRNA decay